MVRSWRVGMWKVAGSGYPSHGDLSPAAPGNPALSTSGE